MANHFARGMMDVTRLTQAGNLTEATALIQALLSGAQPDVPRDTTGASEGAVIEGSYTRLDDPSPAAADAVPPTAPKPAKAPRSRERSGMAETLRKINAGGMPRRNPLPKAGDSAPAGAAFVTLHHAHGGDQRDYKLYIPATKPGMLMPLIVMLHGCTQDPDDFAAGTGMNLVAERHGFLVAYPAQPTKANASKCWNWFKRDDQARDRGEPALIAGIVRDILRAHPVDPSRVYVAGLSAGGAAAAIVAQAYPDIFSAAGVHSGLAVGSATDVPQAFSAMRNGAPGRTDARPVPTISFHGTADSTVNPANGRAVIAQTLPAFGRVTSDERRGVSAGGRSYRQTSYRADASRSVCENWEIDGAGHAWAGGAPEGSFTDPSGPSASEEMVRFFLQHKQT